MVGSDADRDSAHRRHQRLAAANERGQEAQRWAIEVAQALRRIEKIRQVVAGGERPGHTNDQHATDGVAGVRAFERDGHRLIHGEGERVPLVGPVHPDVRMPPASLTITSSVMKSPLSARVFGEPDDDLGQKRRSQL
jgi:hypothetical protein